MTTDYEKIVAEIEQEFRYSKSLSLPRIWKIVNKHKHPDDDLNEIMRVLHELRIIAW